MKNINCTTCGKPIEENDDVLYKEGRGFIHDACEFEEDKTEELVQEILEKTLLQEGQEYDYYCTTAPNKHVTEDGCHWVNLRNLCTDDTWYAFASTYVNDNPVSMITATVDCACGKVKNKEIGTTMSIPNVINKGIELGLLKEIGEK